MLRGFVKTTHSCTALFKTIATRSRPHHIITLPEAILSMDISRNNYIKMRNKVLAFFKERINTSELTVHEIVPFLKVTLLFGYEDKHHWAYLNNSITVNMRNLDIDKKLALIQLFGAFSKQKEAAAIALVGDALANSKVMDVDKFVDMLIKSRALPFFTNENRVAVEQFMIEHNKTLKLPKLCDFIEQISSVQAQMPNFLDSIADYVMTVIDKVPLTAYKSLLYAYASLYSAKYEGLIRAIENNVLFNMHAFTLKELADLIIAFSSLQAGSEELFLSFEKRVGIEIADVDAIDVAPILAAFANRGYYREKLFVLFIRKIKDYAYLLPISDLASLCETYTKVNVLSKVHDHLMPLIIENKEKLDNDSMLRVLYGYSHVHLSDQRSKVYAALAQTVKNSIESLPFFHLSRISYAFLLAGDVKVAYTMLKRAFKEDDTTDPLGALHLLEVAANCAAESEILRQVKSIVIKHMKEYNKDELIQISKLASEKSKLKDILTHIH